MSRHHYHPPAAIEAALAALPPRGVGTSVFPQIECGEAPLQLCGERIARFADCPHRPAACVALVRP